MTDATRPGAGPVVLHVLEAVEGGTARHVVDLVVHVTGRHHVAVPAERVGGVTDRDLVPAVRAAGGQVHVVDMRRNPVHPANAAALVRLHRLAARVRPDIVHGHSAVGGALARLAAPRGTPVVYTPNGLRTDLVTLAVERALAPRTARIVAVSDSEADVVRDRRLAPPARVVVIPNGVDGDCAAPGPDLRALVGAPAEAPVVVMVGRLVPQKRPLDFVAMAAAVAARRPDASFVLVGSGPLAETVDEAIAACGVAGRLRRLPSLPRVAGVLGQCDVVVQPSAFEGGPYVPLEAMREGAAVVVSDSVGNRDAVEHGVSGLVVPVGDVTALADAVSALLDDPTRREALVAAGRARVRDRFSVVSQAAAHAALYTELLRGRAS